MGWARPYPAAVGREPRPGCSAMEEPTPLPAYNRQTLWPPPGVTAVSNPVPADGPPPSFWVRESGHMKQGLKTGTAGLIAYAIYVTFHLPEGYWAVFTALI